VARRVHLARIVVAVPPQDEFLEQEERQDAEQEREADVVRAAGTDGFDGVLVAAAFMTDPRLGLVTALAVCAHEIPQEVGDVAILLHGGYSRRRALALNLITSLTSVIGGVVAYFALTTALHLLPYALAFAAASFIYVAVADLIPGLHRRVDPRAGIEQVLFIGLGVLVVYLTHQQMH